MQQKLGQYITELLYKHDRLSIPGLGSLEMSHAPAMLDQIQGQIGAPAKEISFNEHLVMDDGILTNFLKEQKDWTLEQSQSWVKEQVDILQVALERREIVELDGLGRFFKNFEQQLQFVAEHNNFNTHSFGLKPVMAQAINHSVVERTTLSTSVNNTAVKKKTPLASSWIKKNLWWVALLAILLVSLSIFTLYLQKKADKPIADIDLPKERLNTSPSKTLDETAGVETEGMIVDDNETDPVNDLESAKNIDTEASSTYIDEHTAILAVGLFGDQKNVQKLLERLVKEGFSPITEKEGNMTRVGVSIRFEEETELQKVLREVKQKYAKSAFVMYRDGVRE